MEYYLVLSLPVVVLLLQQPSGASANGFFSIPPEIDPPTCTSTVTVSQTAIDSGVSFTITELNQCICFDVRDYDANRDHFLNVVS